MKKLYLARYRQSPFGKLPEHSIERMLLDAGSLGLNDVDRSKIGHVAVAGLLAPILQQQTLVAGLVAMDTAYRGKSIKGVGNACDSGGLAVTDAAWSILAEQTHVALAVGFEKMHPSEGKLDSKAIGLALGTAAHKDDVFHPFTFPHAFAVIMQRYMAAHGLSEEDMAIIPPIFYANAAHNPLAHMHKTKSPVTVDAVMQSYRLFDEPKLPLKLFECSQISDGWARILVCDEQGLSDLGIPKHETTELAGFGQATDGLSIGSRGADLLRPKAARRAFDTATKMANINPKDISVQEVHDCFSVMAALSAEITGQADEGKGLGFFKDGHASPGGRCPINTSGGLIAKGHPIGATGVAMVGWIHEQLTGKTPAPLAVANAKVGTTLNIGGPICSTVVTVQRPAS
ncbi:MAG: thiolase family protein [Deltaproteobacteria bacterium]|nr:thiolase family protein [Deltaproteobacteria bacterium]